MSDPSDPGAPEFLYPGIHIEEVSFRAKPIAGVSTSVAGFAGPTSRGPTRGASLVTSFVDYERTFGGFEPLLFEGNSNPVPSYMAYAVRGFFENGGRRLYVARVYKPVSRGAAPSGSIPDAAAYQGKASPGSAGTGLAALAEVPEIELVAVPGGSALPEGAVIAQVLIDHAEALRYRFAVLDSPPGTGIEEIRTWRKRFDAKSAGIYYPWLTIDDPASGHPISVPASGHVAGIYARVDQNRGVWKAPANEPVEGILGLESTGNRAQQEILNPEAINVIRDFGAKGNLLWGARTLSADPEWKYVNVRRYTAYLERSIDEGTQWAVFEPNDPKLWDNVRRTVEDFLYCQWKNGALQGNRPHDAFFVRCDRTTMTQGDIDNGLLICLIGAAILKPAEFVIFRISQRKGK
jgi:phage tail sheath protein FI